jgi:hypothetical protein
VLKNNYPSLSRREFLTTAAGAGGAMLLGPAWLNAAADGVDPRVAQVVSGTIGIDMHNRPASRLEKAIRRSPANISTALSVVVRASAEGRPSCLSV